MIYLPLRKTKINLIMLLALIMFQICFETMYKQETYYETGIRPLSRPNRGEYFRVNGSVLDFLDIKLPEETAVLIYLGYFIIGSRIILSARTNPETIKNEED